MLRQSRRRAHRAHRLPSRLLRRPNPKHTPNRPPAARAPIQHTPHVFLAALAPRSTIQRIGMTLPVQLKRQLTRVPRLSTNIGIFAQRSCPQLRRITTNRIICSQLLALRFFMNKVVHSVPSIPDHSRYIPFLSGQPAKRVPRPYIARDCLLKTESITGNPSTSSYRFQPLQFHRLWQTPTPVPPSTNNRPKHHIILGPTQLPPNHPFHTHPSPNFPESPPISPFTGNQIRPIT